MVSILPPSHDEEENEWNNNDWVFVINDGKGEGSLKRTEMTTMMTITTMTTTTMMVTTRGHAMAWEMNHEKKTMAGVHHNPWWWGVSYITMVSEFSGGG